MILAGAASPKLKGKIVGCTIASPAYRTMAEKARSSFERNTGCRCIIINTPKERNYREKFRIPEHFADDETVIYFDADTRWVRHVDVAPLQGIFGMCLDPGRLNVRDFLYQDAQQYGIDPNLYCNSGFMVWHNGMHRNVFEMCLKIEGTMQVRDFCGDGDQSLVNIAVNLTGTKKTILDPEWNYMPYPANRTDNYQPVARYDVIQKPIVVHAAGYHSCVLENGRMQKDLALDYWEAKFMIPGLP
jgi:lipopolysaccharide biosynthesis glycosyltransferase